MRVHRAERVPRGCPSVRCGCLLLAAITLQACSSARWQAGSDPVPSLFEALQDSIVKMHGITRVVDPPPRAAREVPVAAITRLASLLGVPAVHGSTTSSSCSWAPVDIATIGLDGTVREFRIWGDSARVSVSRFCVQRDRGMGTGYFNDLTWMLVRADGRWRVVWAMISVT